jgi:hypothetical protein
MICHYLQITGAPVHLTAEHASLNRLGSKYVPARHLDDLRKIENLMIMK